MSPITHQTIKLSTGSHASPDDGACVMELASMLAGEAFTDHPAPVCPVIASFLRAYNDRVDDERRRDLYAYASRVVGSRSGRAVERDRIAQLARWVSERHPIGLTRLLLALRLRPFPLGMDIDEIGLRAVLTIRHHDDRSHARVLALIDELLLIGEDDQMTPEPFRKGIVHAGGVAT